MSAHSRMWPVFAGISLLLMVTIVAPYAAAAADAGQQPASTPQPPRPTTLQNGDFEVSAADSVISGWKVTTPNVRGYVTAESPAHGASCGALARVGKVIPGDFGNLMQVIDAKPYQGKRVRFSAQVKHTGEVGQAQLWFRVDRQDRAPGYFDNMAERPVRDETWGRYEIVADVEDDAVAISVGILLLGGGTAFIDDADLTVLPPLPKADAPAHSLSDRGLTNLIGFAKLYGYVRHFHPSDPAVSADWDKLAMAGVEMIEGAKNDETLASSLNAFFNPIAPSVKVWVGDGETILDVPPEATHWVSWRHVGFGQQTSQAALYGNVYSSRPVKEPLTSGAPARSGTAPGTKIQADLGGKVHAMIPIGVYADSTGTLPRASGPLPALNRPADWLPNGNDRTTRLADVIIAWNVLEHFYPYFDVTPVDWSAVLRESLKRAAEDRDGVAFLSTLNRFGAALQDGHAQVAGPGMRVYRTPLNCEWVGDLLVVVETPGDSISPKVKCGDVIVSINGRKTADVYADAVKEISAATEQWRRYRALWQMGASAHYDEMSVEVRHPDGSMDAARIHLTGRGAKDAPGSKPQNGTEVAPGVLYFDLSGLAIEALTPFLDKMAAAKGVIFDMRGYPGSAGAAVLPYLTDKKIESAHWNIPVILMPDRQGVTYQTSSWNLGPRDPHLKGKIVFIADGRAISYAESCLGIVEAYHLGAIVGAPTAGTNGNVNRIYLPGKYTVSFTGMQVIKQDGSRHHGVGIMPTVPVSRTIAGIAAGRDEFLEKAIEVAVAQ